VSGGGTVTVGEQRLRLDPAHLVFLAANTPHAVKPDPCTDMVLLVQLEARAAAVPGVVRSRAYTYQIIQRGVGASQYRLALVGLAWPEDRGDTLPL